MFFSIIVPVYNVEPYLRQAVDSALHQDFTGDYEIILIDDGSTDNSGKICDEYAASHANIRVIHKQNGGLSSARNAGLDIAKGEYIVFLDSDDWLELDALSSFAKVLTNTKCECLTYLCRQTFHGKKTFTPFSIDELPEGLYEVSNLIKKRTLWFCAPFFVISSSLVKDIRFENGLLHEDILFMLQVFCSITHIYSLNYIGYNYRIRENSIVHNKAIKHFLRRISALLFISGKITEKTEELPHNDFRIIFFKHGIKGRFQEISWGALKKTWRGQILPYNHAKIIYKKLQKENIFYLGGNRSSCLLMYLSKQKFPFLFLSFLSNGIEKIIRIIQRMKR